MPNQNKTQFNALRIYLYSLLLVLVGLQTGFGQTQINKQAMDSILTAHREMLKEFAFCSCLYNGLPPDSSTTRSKDISTIVLADIAHYAREVYDQVDEAGKAFADSIPVPQIADYNEVRPVAMECLRFYRSKELDQLVKRFDQDLNLKVILFRYRILNPATKRKVQDK